MPSNVVMHIQEAKTPSRSGIVIQSSLQLLLIRWQTPEEIQQKVEGLQGMELNCYTVVRRFEATELGKTSAGGFSPCTSKCSMFLLSIYVVSVTLLSAILAIQF